MRIAPLLGLLAFPWGLTAQGQIASPPPAAVQPRSIPWIYAPWSPTAEYVTLGQDEPGYRRWIMGTPGRATQVALFHQYLDSGGVAYVVPTWQLLRTATDWGRCGAAPFEVPPPDEWANLIQTLRFVRDYVVPAVGPVEPVSAYRNPVLNHCAGGAPESVHMHFAAIDLVPLRPIARTQLIDRLCDMHRREGGRYQVGLGFYTKLRFHVDSAKYRTWGRNDAGSLACPIALAAARHPMDGVVLQSSSSSAPEAPTTSSTTSVPRDPLAPIIAPPPR
jgi:Peptidase M15